MPNSTIYKLSPKSSDDASLYIVDICMDDMVESHRYYLYDAKKNNFIRIKHINKLLEDVQKYNKISEIENKSYKVFLISLKKYIELYNSKNLDANAYKNYNFSGLIETSSDDYKIINDVVKSFKPDDNGKIRK